MSLGSNHILRELNVDELAFVRGGGSDVDLLVGATVQEAGRPTEFIYFPQVGSISFLVISKSGGFTEAGFVGEDGAAGSLHDYETKLHFTRAVVVVPGRALRLQVRRFESLIRSSPSFTRMIMLNNNRIAERAQQLTACNLTHRLEARLCRWLLQAFRGAGGQRIEMTQEALSQFLGVNRPRLNEALKSLEAAGAVAASARGIIHILNYNEVRRLACECASTLRLVPG
jgi:CRP-like cAMP-binding protein